jgi:hypothetical protein
MMRPSSFVAAAVASGALAAAPAASAQQGPTDQGGAPAPQGGAPSAGAGAGGAPGGGGANVTSVYGVVAPPPAGQPIGGGNATESSARPVSGDAEDQFDYAGGGSHGTMTGGGAGPIFFGNEPAGAIQATIGAPPSTHVVQKGDTLWSICDQHLKNPYQWPRIWSYNPQIQNPHWIYPNEQIRLKPQSQIGATPQVAMPEQQRGVGIMAQQHVAPETVFLRDTGFVNDDASLNWGSIVGSPQDKMYLTDLDMLYVRVGEGHDVKVGQELTVFRTLRPVADGQAIAIQGTVRVED